jgi:hypothetical protein
MPLSPTAEASRDSILAELDTALGNPGASIPTEETPANLITDPEWQARLVDGVPRLHFYWIDKPTVEEVEAPQRGRYIATFVFNVHGYMAVKDDGAPPNSYTAFVNEIETVRDAFRQNAAIFGTPERIQISPRLAPMPTFEAIQLGGVLCWHAVIQLRIEATENIAF